MKSLSTVLVSTLLVASAVPAMAASDLSGFYVGLDGRIDQVSWKDKTFPATYRVSDEGVISSTSDTASATDFPEGPMGLGLLFGYRFSPYFAADVGISQSGDENRIMDNDSNKYRYRVTFRQIQADGYAYWPIGTGRLRPFVTAGLAYTFGSARIRSELAGTNSSKTKITTATYSSYFQKGEVDWRIGAGMEVGISDDVSGRIYVRYQPYSFGGLNGGATLGFNLNVLVF